MAQRSIEEVIQTLAPTRRRGIPNPPAIAVGVSNDTGNLAVSFSQAGQQIAQLQAAYQHQADLIADNTRAIQSNTSAKESSAAATAGHIASNVFGGGLGLFSPLISGLESLFGGGKSAPAPLPVYTPPSPVAISAVLQAPPSVSAQPSGAGASMGQAPAATAGISQKSYAPQITVNISA